MLVTAETRLRALTIGITWRDFIHLANFWVIPSTVGNVCLLMYSAHALHKNEINVVRSERYLLALGGLLVWVSFHHAACSLTYSLLHCCSLVDCSVLSRLLMMLRVS